MPTTKKPIFSIQYSGKLPTLAQVEQELVEEAVFITETIEEAAKLIGVSERKVYRVMDRAGLSTQKIRNLYYQRQKDHPDEKR